jgi:dolichol-phosphate mannosyltransferase
MSQSDRIIYSLVLPIFNEELVLPQLFARLDSLLGSLDAKTEVILVDDGSRDRSSEIISGKAKADERYRLISLSRNFGHQIAITAGMDAACGDAVIVMDADLQDPPELVHEMIAKWKAGFQIVYAQRRSRDGESAFKRLTANIFYRVLRSLAAVDIPQKGGVFRLFDGQAIDVFLVLRNRAPFLLGWLPWMAFQRPAVIFDRPPA